MHVVLPATTFPEDLLRFVLRAEVGTVINLTSLAPDRGPVTEEDSLPPVESGRPRPSYRHEADPDLDRSRRGPIRPQALAVLRIVAAVLFIEAGSVLLFNIPPTVHPHLRRRWRRCS